MSFLRDLFNLVWDILDLDITLFDYVFSFKQVLFFALLGYLLLYLVFKLVFKGGDDA